MKNIDYKLTLITNMLKQGASIIMGLAIVPISIKYWGNEKYAVLLVINNIISYVAMSNLGLNAAATILINKTSKFEEKIEILKKTLRVMVGIIIVIIITLLCLKYVQKVDVIKIIGEIPLKYKYEIKYTLYIQSLFLLINLPFSLIVSAIDGFYRVYVNNILQIINLIGNLIILLIVVKLKKNLIEYSIYLGLINLTINMLRLVYLKKYILKNKNIIKCNSIRYKKLMKISLNCFLGSIAAMVLFNTDNLVISNFIGLKMVTAYATTYKLFLVSFSVIYIFNSSVIPKIGYLISCGKLLKISKIYEINYYLIIWIGGGIFLGSISSFESIIYAWAGEGAYAGLGIIFIFAMYSYFYGIVNLNNIFLNTFNYTRDVLVITALEAIFNLVISIILAMKIGLIGVAIGTFTASFFSSNIFFEKKLINRKILIFKNTDFKIKNFFFLLLPFSLISFYISLKIKNLGLNILCTFFLIVIYTLLYYKAIPRKFKKLINLKIRKIIGVKI